MNTPQKILKISANGYRRFYKAHRCLLHSLDARITDENKLIFASTDFLKRLRSDVASYIIEDEETINAETTNNSNSNQGFRQFDDEQILDEPDPYKAILFVIDAIIEFNYYDKNQLGLASFKNRYNAPLK